jgi:iron complex outermembrane receptor protein
LDISRVEVLRGPQGTLYGASALGGTLKYVTNQPQMDVFGGNIFSELSGTDHANSPNWDEQGVINIPLVDGKAALRVAGETGSDAGYVNNIDPSTGVAVKNGVNSTGFNVARATMVWTPTDWLTLTPSIFFQNFDQRDSDAQYTLLPHDQTPKIVAEPGRDRLTVPSFTVNADVGFANLIAVTGNYERQYVRTLDSTVYDSLSSYVCDPYNSTYSDTGQVQPFCGTDGNGNPIYVNPSIQANANGQGGLLGALTDLPSQTYYSNTVRQWSEEVRLVSKPYVPGESALPLTWIAGLYYSDEHTTSTDTEFVRGANAVFNSFGVSPDDPNVLGGAIPGGIVKDEVYQGITAYDTAQYAVFGEGTYYPLPNLRVTVGGRYQFARDGEKTFQNYFYDYGDGGTVTNVGHFYTFLPKFAVSWDITPTNTVYANASKGFRLGSENRRLVYDPTQATSPGNPSYDLSQLGIHSNSPSNFGPDKVWNFELGDKGRFLGGRLTASADVFYILWNSIQTEVPLVTSGDEFQTNAGNAKSYGTEFEFRGRVNESLTAGFSGSYTHATLDRGVVVNGVLIQGTYPHERIPGVPDYNFSADIKQTFRVSDDVNGFVSLAPNWVGESLGNVLGGDPAAGVAPNPDYKRPSTITLDASAGIDFGRWAVTVFGRNLTNNNKIIQRPDIQGSASPIYFFDYLGTSLRNLQGFTLRPLTVGMNASLKF